MSRTPITYHVCPRCEASFTSRQLLDGQLPPHRFNGQLCTPEAPAAGVRWSVLVGNVGQVYDGTDGNEATQTYLTYLVRSQAEDGRAAGEPVMLLKDGEIVRDYQPAVEREP